MLPTLERREIRTDKRGFNRCKDIGGSYYESSFYGGEPMGKRGGKNKFRRQKLLVWAIQGGESLKEKTEGTAYDFGS